MAFPVGASGVGCAASRIYTRLGEGASGNGLFVAWALDFWGSSISSFLLPSSVSIGEVSSFCCLHLLLHCGVNQALFFWIHFLLVNMLLIGEPLNGVLQIVKFMLHFTLKSINSLVHIFFHSVNFIT